MSGKEKETWKDISGYEGFYQVSNLGRIKSLERYVQKNGFKTKKKSKIKSCYVTNMGYLRVELSKNKNNRKFLVHRLVAETFIPNNNTELQVNHIDGNKQNNNINNLEWITPTENNLHAIRLGLKKDFNNKKKKVCKIDENNNVIDIYPSISEAARKNNVCPSIISRCTKGVKKKAANYRWKILLED